jgi:hypothetical protein
MITLNNIQSYEPTTVTPLLLTDVIRSLRETATADFMAKWNPRTGNNGNVLVSISLSDFGWEVSMIDEKRITPFIAQDEILQLTVPYQPLPKQDGSIELLGIQISLVLTTYLDFRL